jgi:hypothetical protein
MGRGKRSKGARPPAEAISLSEEGGRTRTLPSGLKEALAAQAAKLRPHRWQDLQGLYVYGLANKRMIGRGEATSSTTSVFKDPGRTTSYGRAYMQEGHLCSVSDCRDDCVAKVFPDPEDAGRFHVANHLWQELGSLYVDEEKRLAIVLRADEGEFPEVGSVRAKRGQLLDPYLASAAAFFFLLDPRRPA